MPMMPLWTTKQPPCACHQQRRFGRPLMAGPSSCLARFPRMYHHSPCTGHKTQIIGRYKNMNDDSYDCRLSATRDERSYQRLLFSSRRRSRVHVRISSKAGLPRLAVAGCSRIGRAIPRSISPIAHRRRRRASRPSSAEDDGRDAASPEDAFGSRAIENAGIGKRATANSDKS